MNIAFLHKFHKRYFRECRSPDHNWGQVRKGRRCTTDWGTRRRHSSLPSSSAPPKPSACTIRLSESQQPPWDSGVLLCLILATPPAARAYKVGRSGQEKRVGRSGRVNKVGRSGRVYKVDRSGRVNKVGRSVRVNQVGRSGRVSKVGRSGRARTSAHSDLESTTPRR